MKIGEFNELRINRMVDFGAYLIDDDTHEVLLPKRYLSPEMKEGDDIRVFVYNDSENRPVATTEVPKAVVGDFALMRVKAVNQVGAFLDWGLTAKDLLVPFGEQRVDMQAGRSYIVRVYLDEASKRIVASAKLAKFLNKTEPDYYHREKVEVLAKLLLEREVIFTEDVRNILGERPFETESGKDGKQATAEPEKSEAPVAQSAETAAPVDETV